MIDRIQRAGILGFAVMAVLTVAWVVPPLLHTSRRLCPTRPDGVAESYAVPSYARKYGVACSMCHTVYPVLNDVGRRFKDSGYVLDREAENKEAGDKMLMPKSSLWSFVYKAAVAKQKSLKPELLGHKDLFIGVTDGSIAKNVSLWTEMHIKNIDGAEFFKLAFERGRLGWHPSPYANLYAGVGDPVEGMDSQETMHSPNHSVVANRVQDLTDHQRQPDGTLEPANFDQQYFALGGAWTKEKVGALKYWTAIGAGWGSPNAQTDGTKGAAGGAFSNAGTAAIDGAAGQGPLNMHLRVVADTLRGVSFGGYYSFGHSDWTTATQSNGVNYANATANFLNTYRTYAADALVEFGDLAARVLFLDQRMTRMADGVNTSNRMGSYLETFYVFKKDGSPWLAPMLRYEWLADKTAGTKQSFKDYVVAALTYMPAENVRTIVEFWDNTKNRKGGINGFCDNKIQAQVAVGF